MKPLKILLKKYKEEHFIVLIGASILTFGIPKWAAMATDTNNIFSIKEQVGFFLFGMMLWLFVILMNEQES